MNIYFGCDVHKRYSMLAKAHEIATSRGSSR